MDVNPSNIKELSLRQMSLPFDWVIPLIAEYRISLKITSLNHIPNIFINSNNSSHPMSTKTHTLFPHNKFPLDNEKMQEE